MSEKGHRYKIQWLAHDMTMHNNKIVSARLQACEAVWMSCMAGARCIVTIIPYAARARERVAGRDWRAL